MSHSQGIIAASFIEFSEGAQVSKAVPQRALMVDTLRVKDDIVPVEKQATSSGTLIFNQITTD